MGLLQNAESPLFIPTHDGSNQPNHPSVIDFLVEHNMESWAGYRYWMAMTPFPQGNNAHEDPNVVASNDGVTWVIPEDLINPLDDAPGDKEGYGYNADTDMVYNPIEGCLMVYYRWWNADTLVLELRLVKIYADMSYTAPIATITVTNTTKETDKIRSPAIWRESASSWHMWANGGADVGVGELKFWYLHSEDGLNWTDAVQCLDENGLDPFQELGAGYENWHPACKPNYDTNTIDFLVSCITPHNYQVFYAQCGMHTPTLLTVPIEKPIITKSPVSGAWDQRGTYRVSFVRERVGNEDFFRVWYAAYDYTDTWNIGYTEGFLPIPLQAITVIPKINIVRSNTVLNIGQVFKFLEVLNTPYNLSVITGGCTITDESITVSVVEQNVIECQFGNVSLYASIGVVDESIFDVVRIKNKYTTILIPIYKEPSGLGIYLETIFGEGFIKLVENNNLKSSSIEVSTDYGLKNIRGL